MCLNLSYLEPSDIEEKLQQGKNRDVQIQVMSCITLGWVKELPSNETSYKEAVYSNSYHLWKQDKKQVQLLLCHSVPGALVSRFPCSVWVWINAKMTQDHTIHPSI